MFGPGGDPPRGLGGVESLTLLDGGDHTRCSHMDGAESMRDGTSGSSKPGVDIDSGDYGDRESLRTEACR